MILVAFILSAIITGIGIYMNCTYGDWKETLGFGLNITFSIISVVLFIAALVLTKNVIDVVAIDERMVMYQEENSKIETQIAEVVNQYQKYETDIFESVSKENAITYVTLFPELKSDTLVQKQIETYIANNEKIKELKEDAILAPTYRWWLYFGK